MRTGLKWAAAVIALGAAGAIAFAWSGIFNVAASRGHWPVTAWFLHFTMQNSVRTHAFGIETPGNLSDPALVARGAGHYHLGCAACHGAPGIKRSLVVKQMVPPPPYLVEHVADWKPRELFWIVKHGIKYAGMPAWPSQERDDEVWAAVAFLLQLPEMSTERYIELATGASAAATDGAGAALTDLSGASANPIAACAQCHGMKGLGRNGDAFPRLAGQKAEYLRATLEDFASGERNSGIMQPIAHALTMPQIATVAAHYAAFEWQALAETDSAGSAELGRRLAVEGLPDESIPACQSCHGGPAAAGDGEADDPARPHFPRLAGQHESYIREQLELFRSNKRGGRRAQLMRGTAERLTDEQISAVAAYYASLAAPASKAASSAPSNE